ncbi:hypothetical protein [Microcoleus sp. OTE_8_concoct_300]
MVDSKTAPPHADWMGLEQDPGLLNQIMIFPVGNSKCLPRQR